ncbi:MAG: ATP-binding protein [Steroidobacteraceae bacterium]
MNHRSLVFRLGALYTLLLSAAFALVGAGTFYGLQHYLHANLRDTLKRRTAQVQQILVQLPAGTANDAIARELETRVAPEFNNRFLRVTRLPGTLLYLSGPPNNRSFDPPRVPAGQALDSANAAIPRISILTDQQLMISASTVRADTGRYLIELGASITTIDATLDHLFDYLALLLPALTACAAGGGYLLISWALRPVDRLAQTAERMSLQDATLRLPVISSGDVLERLANSLNNMLGRLRDSVQTSRRFLADASHELRTPLTVIKGELQELAGGAVDLRSGELRERVGSVLEEVGRLEHLVSGLLALSRLDGRVTQTQWVDVDLAELALSTAEQMRLMAVDRGIEIDLWGLERALIHGDRARLKQIIVNLLDNAIRFTPRGGRVALSTCSSDTARILELSDTGIGIPAASIPHVFDRFFRVDEARSRDDGGAGLGLSIVKSICSLHGAEIEVESEVGRGSVFRVKFPVLCAVDSFSPPKAPPNRAERASARQDVGMGVQSDLAG